MQKLQKVMRYRWQHMMPGVLAIVALVCVTLLILVAAIPSSWAMSLYEGENLSATLDTTLTYGLMFRVQGRDKDQIGGGNGGDGANPNWDDGDLNYDTGLISNRAQITSELDVSSKHFGAFVRATGFYDFENMNGSREYYDLSSDAEDQVGRDVDLLDAFIWGSTHLGSFPVQLRLGEQVVNWGESTFILGGIGLNTINPIDVSKLRSPGAELREALVPVGMVYASVGLSQNLSVEFMYVYDYEETKLDEGQTYFGGIDFAGNSGQKVIAGNVGDNADLPASQSFIAVPRADSVHADDQGQFGVALRYYASWLHDTEFTLYYMNYHSKLPTLDMKTGTVQGAQNAVAAAGQVYGAHGVNPGDNSDVDTLASAMGTDAYLKTAAYRTAFEEDIELFGVGFNTEIFGWGFQGEVSHRKDVPLQIEDTELLFAALAPIDPTGGLAAFNQVGDYSTQFDTWIPGSVKKDLTQAQVTVSKLLGAIFGSSGSAFLAEVACLHVHGMPSKRDLRLETYGPYGTGNSLLGPATGTRVESSSDFPDANSWGYVLYWQLDYNNLIGPISFSPNISWSHDVQGISPNGGPFIEGRKAVTVGVNSRYLDHWTAGINYTNYFGADELNQINDRDFISLNIKYSF